MKKVVEKVVVSGREIRDNIVHYKVKAKFVPIYEFEEFTSFSPFLTLNYHRPRKMHVSIKDVYMVKTSFLAALVPKRVIERKGNKYNVEFVNSRGTVSSSWVDRTALGKLEHVLFGQMFIL